MLGGRFCTAKTQFRKFQSNISRKELLGLCPNFNIHLSVSNLHNPTKDWSAYSAAGKYVERSWE